MKRLIALALLLAAEQAAARGLDSLARELGSAGRRRGLSRVAVLPFTPADASSPADGRVLSERLTTRLVRDGRVGVVERSSLLRRLADEQNLARTGLVDGLRRLGKLHSIDALVAGTFVTRGGRLSVEARLLDVRTGAILAAGEAMSERDWHGEGRLEPGAEPGPLPDLSLAAAELGEDEYDCSASNARADALEKSAIELKARHWAGLLRQGLSFSDLRRAPGQDISDEELKWRFFDRLNAYYAAPDGAELTPNERAYLALVERTADKLRRRCGVAG